MANDDLISRQAAIDALERIFNQCEEIEAHFPDGDPDKTGYTMFPDYMTVWKYLHQLPSEQPEIIRCKDCKHWRQQTNYQGAPLSFGFCESEDMWQSLYGETCEVEHIDTDDDFYCGYAKRRTDELV